jgi:chemotaxis protein CheZ
VTPPVERPPGDGPWAGDARRDLPGRARDERCAADVAPLAAAAAVEPFVGLRGITDDLAGALRRFRAETRLDELASEDVPDARLRLEHVLQLTDAAAHRTLDLVEQAYPIAERIARRVTELAGRRRQGKAAADVEVETFLAEVSTDVDRVRAQLSEVLLAQGYQDLTGQIIRGMLGLVTVVEAALKRLIALSPADASHRPAGRPVDIAARHTAMLAGCGPDVPQIEAGPVVGGQCDADALLREFGR